MIDPGIIIVIEIFVERFIDKVCTKISFNIKKSRVISKINKQIRNYFSRSNNETDIEEYIQKLLEYGEIEATSKKIFDDSFLSKISISSLLDISKIRIIWEEEIELLLKSFENFLSLPEEFHKPHYQKYIEDLKQILKDNLISLLSEELKSTYTYSHLIENSKVLKNLEKRFDAFLSEERILGKADEEKRSQFLKRINSPEEIRFKYIDKFYVPPENYNEILNKLKEYKIVLIKGTPGFGKTYTSIYILWEYFNSGYYPYWIHGETELEREKVKLELLKLNEHIPSKSIIYFEDPFGKVEYEPDVNLEKGLGEILKKVSKEDDIFIILTTREEVYKDFKECTYSKELLTFFEVELSLKKKSYSYDLRKQILLNLSRENCEWFKIKNLQELVFNELKNELKLPTPLNIKDFAVASSSSTNSKDLLDLITLYSKHSYFTFAKEIKSLSNDKVVFFSFLFISEYFSIEFIHNHFDILKRELKLKKSDPIKKIINRFRNDKISINENNIVKFTHDSYSQALYFLLKDGEFRRFFSKIIFYLFNIKTATWGTCRIIIRYYQQLPKKIQDLVFNYANDDLRAEAFANTILEFYDNLPKKVTKIVFNQASIEYLSENVAYALDRYFDKIPQAPRNKLLEILLDHKYAYYLVFNIILKNFNVISIEIKNSLLSNEKYPFLTISILEDLFDDLYEIFPTLDLIDRNEIMETFFNFTWVTKFNFDFFMKYSDLIDDNLRKKLKNKLFSLISEEEDALIKNILLDSDLLPNQIESLSNYDKEKLIENLLRNFEQLPQKFIRLLYEFAENEQYGGIIGEYIFKFGFDVLNENVIELLITLYKYDNLVGYVTEFLIQNYDSLPDILKLLITRSSKRTIEKKYFFYIAMNQYNSLPNDLKRKFDKEIEDVELDYDDCIDFVYYYRDLPQSVRKNLLLRILSNSSDINFAKLTCEILDNNFNIISDDLRNKIIEDLYDNEMILYNLAKIVEENAGDIPKHIVKKIKSKISSKVF